MNHLQKRERYAKLPDSVLKGTGLSAESKLVYAILARHVFKGGLVYIGQRRIASMLEMSQASVSRRIKELLSAGHIEMTDIGSPGKRRGYHLISTTFLPREKKQYGERKPGFSSVTRAAGASALLSSGARGSTLDDIMGERPA